MDQEHDVAVVQDALIHTDTELKLLLEASWVCPMDAFYIETDDGSTFNAWRDLTIRRAIKEGRYTWAPKA